MLESVQNTLTNVPRRTFTVRLPWPPSVNAYYRSPRFWSRKNGTVQSAPRVLISAEGRAYRKAVALATLTGWPKPASPLAGRLRVQICANPPDRRKRDLDNLLKAVLDGLQHAGWYAGDDQIDDLHIGRGLPHSPGYLAVTIEELP